MKLISMVDFVVKQRDVLITYKNHDKGALFERCDIYASFLKQPLELWMFVPCDLVMGKVVVLKEPYDYQLYEGGIRGGNEQWNIECEKYQQAKERCLFDGFESQKQKDYYIITLNENALWVSWNKSKTIEDLIPYNLQLTATAIKQIGCDH